VTWGSFARDLAALESLDLSAAQVDLRRDVVGLLRVPRRRSDTVRSPRARVGAVDAAAAALRVSPGDLGIGGRGGRRLAALVGIVKLFAERGLPG